MKLLRLFLITICLLSGINIFSNQAIRDTEFAQAVVRRLEQNHPNAGQYIGLTELTDENGASILYLAASQNLPEVVEKITKVNPALINKPTDLEFTPLHAVAAQGYTNLLEPLVEAGAELDATSKTGLTPLHLAARANDINTFIKLLELGANPLIETTTSSVAPLQNAFNINSTFKNEHRMEIAVYKGDLNAVASYLSQPIDRQHIIDALKVLILQNNISNQNEILQTLLQYHNPSANELSELLLLASSGSNEMLQAVLKLNGHVIPRSTMARALTNAVLALQASNVQTLVENNAPTKQALDTIKQYSEDPAMSASSKQRLADLQELITLLRPQSSDRLSDLFAAQPMLGAPLKSPRVRPGVLSRSLSSDEIPVLAGLSTSTSIGGASSVNASPEGSRSLSPTPPTDDASKLRASAKNVSNAVKKLLGLSS